MNTVQPIKDKQKIEDMKIVLRASNYRDYLLFVLGINTGLRISDLLQIRLEDIIDAKGKIKESIIIKEIKTGKTRQIIINSSLKKALKEYLATNPDIKSDYYLFRSRKGVNSPISRIQAWHILNKAAQSVAIKENIGSHSLRKTFGFHAYNQGIDITLLQKIFNHSTPSVTLRYIGITQQEINSVYFNLNL